MGVDELFRKAMEAKDRALGAGQGKIREALEAALADLRGLRPFIGRCGFSLTEVRLTLSVPPGVAATVEETGGGSGDLAKVFLDPRLTSFQRALVGALEKAYSLQGMAAANGMRIARVVLEISVPPSVDVHLVPTLIPDGPGS